MKKKLSALLVAVFAFSLMLYGQVYAASKEKPVKITISCAAIATHPYVLSAKWSQEKLNELGSSITLDIHPGGILGGERETVEGVMLGSIDMGLVADMSIAGFIPEMAFANFPGLFKDYNDVQKLYYNGWVGERVKKLCAAKGLKVLGFNDNDFRWITNSKRKVTKPEDIKGLKLRVPEVAFLVDFFKEFGALPTPIALGELATALQQGVVDGQELGATCVYPYGFYEFNKYMTRIHHSYSAAPIILNMDKWNSLSAKQQKELQTAIDYGTDKEFKHNRKYVDEVIAKMKTKGVVFSEMTPELQQAILKTGKKLASSPKYLNAFGQDVVDKMYPSK